MIEIKNHTTNHGRTNTFKRLPGQDEWWLITTTEAKRLLEAGQAIKVANTHSK